MNEIFKRIREAWSDPEALNKILIDVAERYQEEGERLSSAVINEASAFESEKSSGFKTTVTEALYRAKTLSGGGKYIAEGNMRALELITDAVQLRIKMMFSLNDGISQVSRGVKTSIPHESSPEAISE